MLTPFPVGYLGKGRRADIGRAAKRNAGLDGRSRFRLGQRKTGSTRAMFEGTSPEPDSVWVLHLAANVGTPDSTRSPAPASLNAGEGGDDGAHRKVLLRGRDG